MMNTPEEADDPRTARRKEIETILAGYPGISEDECAALRRWFNREASALDVGLVASNEELRASYKAFRKDHIDRFMASDLLRGLVFAAIVTIIAFGLVWQGL